MARAPIWAPRSGIPVQLALEWNPAPLNGQTLLFHEIAGVLTPADLIVFTNLCSLYLVQAPADRRVSVSLGQVSRWAIRPRPKSRSDTPGGKNRDEARDSLTRLRQATFTGALRSPGPRGEIRVGGWGLIDFYQMPAHGRRNGHVTINEQIAQLLDAGSFVRLDAELLTSIYRASAIAARLWVWLEAETLTEVTRFALFGGLPGEPARERSNPAIADLLRLGQARRRQAVQRVRKACEVIAGRDGLDPRYKLEVLAAAEPGMWNLSANRDSRVTHQGLPRDANRDSRVTHQGLPRDAAPEHGPRSDDVLPERGNRDSRVTHAGAVVDSLVGFSRRGLSSSRAPASAERGAPDEKRRPWLEAYLQDPTVPAAVKRRLAEEHGVEVPA
jgi:hypothetical protein